MTRQRIQSEKKLKDLKLQARRSKGKKKVIVSRESTAESEEDQEDSTSRLLAGQQAAAFDDPTTGVSGEGEEEEGLSREMAEMELAMQLAYGTVEEPEDSEGSAGYGDWDGGSGPELSEEEQGDGEEALGLDEKEEEEEEEEEEVDFDQEEEGVQQAMATGSEEEAGFGGPAGDNPKLLGKVHSFNVGFLPPPLEACQYDTGVGKGAKSIAL
jgi:hypothetical protein